jgi:HK97 family phage portal protein
LAAAGGKEFWSDDRWLPNALGDGLSRALDFAGKALPSARSRSKPPEEKRLSDISDGTYTDSSGVSWAVSDSAGVFAGKKKDRLTLQQATDDGYKASTWVYICVSRLMAAISSVPWLVEKEVSPGKWEPAPEHSFNALLQKPNDFIGWQRFAETFTAHKFLAGNALIHKSVDSQGEVMGLFILRPDYITPKLDDKHYLKYYEYNLNAGKRGAKKDPVRFKREKIIHLMLTDPVDPTWGMSPLIPGGRVVDTDIAATEYNVNLLDNQGSPSGLLSLDREMDDKDYKAAKEFAKDQIEGAANVKRVLVLGDKANYTPFIMSPEDMAFIEGRKLNRVEICALFKIPPPIAGIYDFANYKVETARKIFWLDTIVPELNAMVGEFNFSLDKELGEGYRIGYDTANVQALLLILDDLLIIAKKLWDMGYPLDAINRRLGLNLSEIPGSTNVAFVPSTVIPSGSDPMGINEPVNEDDDD